MLAFTHLSAGSFHTCALDVANRVSCWGYDADGQISAIPAGTFDAIDAGQSHNCGLATDGSLTCWGAMGTSLDYGQVTETPGGSFIAISTGTSHSCAISQGGTLACWGRDHIDQVSGAP